MAGTCLALIKEHGHPYIIRGSQWMCQGQVFELVQRLATRTAGFERVRDEMNIGSVCPVSVSTAGNLG